MDVPNTTFVPKVWPESRPMPYIPTVDGLTQHEYKQSLAVTWIENCSSPGNQWTGVIDDPRTGWYGIVLARFQTRSWYAIGHREHGIVATRPRFTETMPWPWELAESVRFLVAHHVFAEAHREGRTRPYWIEAAKNPAPQEDLMSGSAATVSPSPSAGDRTGER